MPDKKLTDKEIVKDLNEAKDLENVLLYCKNPNKEVMTPIKITDIRDLINRLQAENDNLKNDELPKCKDALRRANEIGMELQEEIERLKEENERLKKEVYRKALL